MKKIKLRLISLIGVIIMVFTLTSCEGKDVTSKVINESLTSMTEEISSKVSKPENYTITLITMNDAELYWQIMNEGCEQAVEDLKKEKVNINYTFSPVDAGKDEPMSEKLEQAIEKKNDAILVTPTGRSSILDHIELTKDSGIAVVLLDQLADGDDWDAFYAHNNYEMGILAGEKMLEQLKIARKTSGKIGIIGVNKDTESTMEREEGFRSVFKDKSYKLLDTEYTEGDPSLAEIYTKKIINEHELIGVFNVNYTNTIGVAGVIEEADKKDEIVLVGYDCSKESESFFESGAIDISINQDPYEIGYQGMMGTIKVLQGEKLNPKVIDLPPVVVTKDNYKEYFY